jgi:curved DNA-binding protein CbpA
MPTPDIHSDDYYKVLGVERSANDHEIGKAYKKMALKHHPDKNPDNKEKAEENFKLITEAYDVLSNADKRKTYDQFGKGGLQNGGGGGPGGGVSFQQADDIFKAFFGGQDPFSMFFSQDDDGFGGMGGKGGPRVVFRSGPGGGGMGGMGGMPGGMFFDMGGGGMGGMPGMGGMGKGMGSKGAAPQRRAPTPAYVLPDHTTVTIRGLVKAQEHNGKTGKISGWDDQKSRYSVSLERDETLSLRPSNLTQRCDVEITGIESQPQLNGQLAEVLNYIDEQNRYQVKLKVKMEGGRDVIGVRPDNVIFQKGTRVIVTGLSNAEFNGQMAQIQDVDREAMRYTVNLQSGKAIKIKLENVLC